jgi:hypothetical protein
MRRALVSKLRSHLTYANVGVTVALVLATTGFAVASIPGRGGTISACYRKADGGLRVIDTSKRGSAGKCGKRERSLSWSQLGPQGLRGIQGAPGVNGGQGPKGDSGTPGTPGTNGTDGTNGNDGSPGAPGANGTTIVARARSVGMTSTVHGNTQVAHPLNGATWTQGATESDWVYGSINFTLGSCTGGNGVLTGSVSLDGTPITTTGLDAPAGTFDSSPTPGTRTVGFYFGATPLGSGSNFMVYEPASGTPQMHTLTAAFGDNSSGCGAGSGFYDINKVAIDVAAAH